MLSFDQLSEIQEGPGPIKTPSQNLSENIRMAGFVPGPGPRIHPRLYPEIPITGIPTFCPSSKAPPASQGGSGPP